MAFFGSEDIRKAKEMDLLTYLQNYEPQQLVRVTGNIYCTKDHDSLRISNGKWYWFSRGFGGKSAVDYLIAVRGCTFMEAVGIILGQAETTPPVFCPKTEEAPRKLLMPALSDSTEMVERYLLNRGIAPSLIDYCINHKLLFESADIHNALFIGYDEKGVARYGGVRATVGRYKGDLTGSDKHYSFSIDGDKETTQLHLFESAIDLLSYETLRLYRGQTRDGSALLSLAGVYPTKRENVVPVALRRYLDNHPLIRTVHLHLDNDNIGRTAARGIAAGLQGECLVLDEPPSCGKDVNEELQITMYEMRRKENERV